MRKADNSLFPALLRLRSELRAGLERLATEKRVTTAALPGVKGVCYVWKEE